MLFMLNTPKYAKNKNFIWTLCKIIIQKNKAKEAIYRKMIGVYMCVC